MNSETRVDIDAIEILLVDEACLRGDLIMFCLFRYVLLDLRAFNRLNDQEADNLQRALNNGLETMQEQSLSSRTISRLPMSYFAPVST